MGKNVDRSIVQRGNGVDLVTYESKTISLAFLCYLGTSLLCFLGDISIVLH